MGVFNKVFGKKKTVDTTRANQANAQQQQQAVQNGPNEQANAFDGFEIMNEIPDGTPVADVYLNVDTESESRSHMNFKEMAIDGSVGHTWLSIKPIGGQLPADLTAMVQPQTRALVDAHGETAMGFWPIMMRQQATTGKFLNTEERRANFDKNERLRAEMDIRQDKGFTHGSGTIMSEQAPQYDLHHVITGRDTDGRVEEPDDAHTPKGRKIYRITRKQFREIYRYIDAHRTHKYNLYTYNCTTFAAHALRAAGLSVAMSGMTMPTSLYEAMYKEAKAYEKAKARAKKHNEPIGPASVQLLKLAEGEVHRDRGDGKAGPHGKKVRVKGVERFDMPMYTDQAEIVLRRVVNSGERPTGRDKSEFAQELFRNAHRRSADAASEYAQKAFVIGLVSIEQRDSIRYFYGHGFHLVEDPTIFTAYPQTYADYFLTLKSAMPNLGSLQNLMDGNTLSPKHDLNELAKATVRNVFKTDKEVGGAFEALVKPMQSLFLVEPTAQLVKETFLECIRNNKRIARADLKRTQYLMMAFSGNRAEYKDAAKEYLKGYFNYRITNHILTQQDYNDLLEFGMATGMNEMIQPWLAKMQYGVNKSRRYMMHGMVYGKGDQAVSAVPKKYVKAQKAPRNAPKPDENEIVAEAYLNVDVSPTLVGTQNVSRSSLSMDVGHTWLTLKAKPAQGQNQGTLPADIEAEIQNTDTGRNTVNIIRAKGETAMGFWPLNDRFIRQDGMKYGKNTNTEQRNADTESNSERQAALDVRAFKGFTRGRGEVAQDQTQYKGFSFVRDVAGRVEEPDDAHTPIGRKRFTLTRKQFKKIYQYIEAHRNHDYNLKTYNCTTFATHALRAAGHTAGGSRAGICYPARMYLELYDEAKRDQREHRAGDVQLLRLRENESHGEFRPEKAGNGAQVRVQGVEKFDMVTQYVDDAEVTLRRIEREPDKRNTLTDRFHLEMLEGFQRSVPETENILRGAVHAQIVTTKQTEAFLNARREFADLAAPLENLVNQPSARQLRFLELMNEGLGDETFQKIFGKTMRDCLLKAVEYKIGSADFANALKISELLVDADNLQNRMIARINSIQITTDVAAAVVHLNAMYVLRSAETVFTTCLKANANDPDTTARFVRNLLRSPNCKEEAYSVLGGILIRLATMVRRPEALLSVAEKLKNDGYLEQRQLAAIQHQIQRRQPNP